MPDLNPTEEQFVEYFSQVVKVFGLPKSVGEIYGLMYASPAPLCMDTLIDRLNISKGSCSQGLKLLRSIGAVLESSEGRKTYYSANIELKSLIAGLMREQVQPLLLSSKETVKNLSQSADTTDDPEMKNFYQSRISKLATWRRRASFLTPIITRILGKTE